MIIWKTCILVFTDCYARMVDKVFGFGSVCYLILRVHGSWFLIGSVYFYSIPQWRWYLILWINDKFAVCGWQYRDNNCNCVIDNLCAYLFMGNTFVRCKHHYITFRVGAWGGEDPIGHTPRALLGFALFESSLVFPFFFFRILQCSFLNRFV